MLHFARAGLYLDAGWHESAIAAAGRFLAHEPDHAIALTIRARAREGLGQHLAAAEDYTSAIDRSPAPSPQLFLERAQALKNAGEQHLEKALQGLDEGLRKLGPIVTLRGTQECVDYYRLLYEQVAERVDQGLGSIPEEKYRLLWDNLPIWFKMRQLEEFFEKQRCTLVATTYANSWGGITDYGAAEDADPYRALAKTYLNVYINFGFQDRINYLAQLIEEFSLTGFIMHSNRSCKPYSVGMYTLRDEVSKRTGKPGVVIEADQNDPRVYSDAQTETRLEAFVESMEPVR